MYKSLAEQARASLEEMIVFNELEDGVLYSEKQLAVHIGLGRTPVREALQRLAHDRMVTIHPRKGVQVVGLTITDQLRILEVRRAIEGACVHHAAMRATEGQKQRMRGLADGLLMAALQDEDTAVLGFLREIHECLVEATQNLFFAQAMSPLLSLSRRFWFMNKDMQDSRTGALLYQKILYAVCGGDCDQAALASQVLMDYLRTFAEKEKAGT